MANKQTLVCIVDIWLKLHMKLPDTMFYRLGMWRIDNNLDLLARRWIITFLNVSGSPPAR